MKLIKMTCPSCGANLELHTDKPIAFCEFCGAKLMIDDESMNIHITNRYVDEAQLKALDLEKQKYETEQVRLKEYQQKEAEWKKILVGWICASGVTFFLYSLFQNVRFLSTFTTALSGAVLVFGGIGVWFMKPKKDTPQNNGISFTAQPEDSRAYYITASPKSRFTAFVLCLFLGYFGAHYFYVRRYGMGAAYLFTAGLFGFGGMYDIVMVALGRFKDDQGLQLR